MPKDHDQKLDAKKILSQIEGLPWIPFLESNGSGWEIWPTDAGTKESEPIATSIFKSEHLDLLLNAPKLLAAALDCLEDLRHYARTHGPGPDQRLAKLEETIANIARI